jgi:peroxiredoxin
MDLLLIGAVVYGISWFQGRNLPVDAPAPEFSLRDMDGNVHKLSDYKGKSVLLVFWAPWCSVCSVESGNVSSVSEWVSDDDDVEVLSVVVGYQNLDSVQKFIADNEVTYPVLLGTRDISQRYGVSSFPTHLVIDESGRIDSAGVGYTTTVGMWVRLWWAG